MRASAARPTAGARLTRSETARSWLAHWLAPVDNLPSMADDEAEFDGANGDAHASSDEMLDVVYQELRRLARQRLAPAGNGASLVPTELVHEAYLRLVDGGDPRWANRAHFFSAAAESMRRILVDRARARGTLKRGEGRAVTLVGDEVASEERSEELCALDEALELLEESDERLALIVKLRYFAGLTVDEIAALLDVVPRTVFRDWSSARAWLRVQIESGEQR